MRVDWIAPAVWEVWLLPMYPPRFRVSRVVFDLRASENAPNSAEMEAKISWVTSCIFVGEMSTRVKEEFSASPAAATLITLGEYTDPEMSHALRAVQIGHDSQIALAPFSFNPVSPRSNSSSVRERVFFLSLRTAAREAAPSQPISFPRKRRTMIGVILSLLQQTPRPLVKAMKPSVRILFLERSNIVSLRTSVAPARAPPIAAAPWSPSLLSAQ
mmetsp:Transcript_12509/g.25527  ORF Transcript_12509/g.25527 Transcript_12509/m.25527 type:complete len:215 (+) Transcript_12509:456-1100(+)